LSDGRLATPLWLGHGGNFHHASAVLREHHDRYAGASLPAELQRANETGSRASTGEETSYGIIKSGAIRNGSARSTGEVDAGSGIVGGHKVALPDGVCDSTETGDDQLL
jgi:hypothetical protein